MTEQEKQEATVVKRILDANTRELVGWLYRWDTGQEAPKWIDGRRDDVIYE